MSPIAYGLALSLSLQNRDIAFRYIRMSIAADATQFRFCKKNCSSLAQ